jgi:hypothetical protein
MKWTKWCLQVCLAALLGAALSSACVAQENADIFGRWRIVKVLGAADVAAMSDKEAQALVGKVVQIEKKAFVFNGEVCTAPSYERVSQALAQSFREEGHASATDMGLPDPVTSIDARCTHLFLKKPGLIVIHWNGYYFDAVKTQHSLQISF